MILTRKIPVHPEQTLTHTLWYISRCCNRVWNEFISDRRQAFDEQRKVNYYTQKKLLPGLKKQDERLKDPASQVLQEVCKSIQSGYQSFFEKRKKGDSDCRPPGFRSGKRFFTQHYPQRDNSFRFKGNQLSLSFGRRPADWLTLTLPEGDYSKVTTVKLSYDDLNQQFYVSLTENVHAKEPLSEGDTLYFDPGCKTTLTGITTSGQFYEYDINPLRQMNKSTYLLIDQLMSRRDKKNKGSKPWRRLNKRVRSLWRKINTRTKQYLHNLAQQILQQHPTIKRFTVGDWKKQETLADTGHQYINKSINRAVQNNNPVRKLIEYLSYKAELNGQCVDDFDERGTTRTCVQCNQQHEKGISPDKRMFVCESCGFEYPRDHHSGLNFLKRFESAMWHSLSGNTLPDRSKRTTLAPFSLKSQSWTVAFRQTS